MDNQLDQTIGQGQGNAMGYGKGLCVFDLDGTLVNTLGDLAEALNFGLSSCGLPTLAEHQVSAIVGHSTKYMFQHAVPAGKEDQAEAVGQGYRAYYAKHCCDTSLPYDGIIKCLTTLKAAGLKLAVASNKPHSDVVRIVNTLFPKDLFSLVLGQSQRFPLKPAPEPLQFVLDFFNAPKEAAVYIGDSEVDVDFANNTGLQCLSVCWGFRTRQELVDAGAQTILDEPAELEERLLERFGIRA